MERDLRTLTVGYGVGGSGSSMAQELRERLILRLMEMQEEEGGEEEAEEVEEAEEEAAEAAKVAAAIESEAKTAAAAAAVGAGEGADGIEPLRCAVPSPPSGFRIKIPREVGCTGEAKGARRKAVRGANFPERREGEVRMPRAVVETREASLGDASPRARQSRGAPLLDLCLEIAQLVFSFVDDTWSLRAAACSCWQVVGSALGAAGVRWWGSGQRASGQRVADRCS